MKCFYSKKKIALQSNHVKNVTTYTMKYLLNTSSHHHEMFRHSTSMFTVTETILDRSSRYFGILYCLKTELKCQSDYKMFQLRCDMCNKPDDDLFMKLFKPSLKKSVKS